LKQPRARRHTRHANNIGIWNATCRDCKTTFRVFIGLKPKFCISCKGTKLTVKPGRMNRAEKAEMDARFVHAASHFVFSLLDMFGIPVPPLGSSFPPPAGIRSTMSRHDAALFLATHAVIPKDYILDSTEARDKAYRIAASKLHPDKQGGSHELFVKLQEAKAALA